MSAAPPSTPVSTNSQRLRNEAPTFEELVALLPRLHYPITTRDFARVVGLQRSIAAAKLSQLVSRKCLVELPGGTYEMSAQFSESHKKSPSSNSESRVVDEAFEMQKAEILSRLERMKWPMSREDFIEAVPGPYKVKMAVFKELFGNGILTKTRQGFVYSRAHPRSIKKDVPIRGKDFDLLLNRLPEVFSRVQFSDVCDISSHHASTVLHRLSTEPFQERDKSPDARKKIQYIARGEYQRVVVPLPLTFDFGQFAVYFGLTYRRAADILLDLMAEGKVKETQAKDGGVLFGMSASTLILLEERLRVVEPMPFDYEVMQKRMDDLPTLNWPMSAQDYCKVYDITLTPAKMTLQRFIVMGLLKIEDGKGRANLYNLTGAQEPLMSPREAQKIVQLERKGRAEKATTSPKAAAPTKKAAVSPVTTPSAKKLPRKATKPGQEPQAKVRARVKKG